METIEQIAQWVIDNRYPKNENNKVSDFEMYQTLLEAMNRVLRQCNVSRSLPLALEAFRKKFADVDFKAEKGFCEGYRAALDNDGKPDVSRRLVT